MTDTLPSIFTMAKTPIVSVKQTLFASRLSTSVQPGAAQFLFENLEHRVMLTANIGPTFTSSPGAVVVEEDSALKIISHWATDISAGTDEESQQLYFTASVNNDPLFSVAPTVSVDGTLRFAPAPNANGTAHVTVYLHDFGGTADGGSDTSVAHTFNITVTPVNDAPTIASLIAGPYVAVGTGSSAGASFVLTAVGVTDPDGPVANVRFYEDTNDNGELDATDPMVALGHRSGNNWSAAVTHAGFAPTRYFVQASDESGYNSNLRSTPAGFDQINISSVVTSAAKLRAGKSFKLTALKVSGASAVDFYRDTNDNGIIDVGDEFLGTGRRLGKNWQLTTIAPVVPSLFDAHRKKIPVPVTFRARGSAGGSLGVTISVQAKVL